MRTISASIPVFTEGGDFDGTVDEDEARELIRLRRGTLVRDRKGTIRRIILIASVHHKLTGKARQQAIDSYRGIDKYTYREYFETVAAGCHMLKRYNTKTGTFVKWPEPKKDETLLPT